MRIEHNAGFLIPETAIVNFRRLHILVKWNSFPPAKDSLNL
jgi:hypothetical protein